MKLLITGSGERGWPYFRADSAHAHPNRDNIINQVNAFADIDTDGPFKDFAIKLKI